MVKEMVSPLPHTSEELSKTDLIIFNARAADSEDPFTIIYVAENQSADYSSLPRALKELKAIVIN